MLMEEPILNAHNKDEHRPSHTAEHLLNQTMVRMFGCERSKNAHIERKKSKINFCLAQCPTDEQIEEIEKTLNRLIEEDLPVRYEFVTRDNIPEGVNVDIKGNVVTVKGKLGELSCSFDKAHVSAKVEDGKVVIAQEGKQKKFVKSVEQVTFNGDIAVANGQQVMYMTERCVFVLKEDGMHLTEIAPGIDLQTQILDQMEFEPIIDRDENGEIKLMPAVLFTEGLMGLKEMKA